MSSEKMSSASRGENEGRPSDVPHTAVLVENSRPRSPVLADSSPGFPHTAVLLSAVGSETGVRSTGADLERGEGGAGECGREHLSSSVSNHPRALKETVEETRTDSHSQASEGNDVLSSVDMSACSESSLTVETTPIATSSSPSCNSPVAREPVESKAGLVDDKGTVKGDDGTCSNEQVPVEQETGFSNSSSDDEPSIMDLDVKGLLDVPPATDTASQAHSVDDVPKAKKAASRKAKRDATSAPREKHQKKARPNAFVSVRISSAEIHSKLREVQEGMVATNESLSKVLVPIEKLHITLMVLQLDSDEAVASARDALEASAAKCRKDFEKQPLALEFLGLGSFNSHRVVFATVAEGEQRDKLGQLAAQVRLTFAEHGLPDAGGSREFSPHLTVAKTSRGGRNGPRSIKQSSYVDFSKDRFGTEVVGELELLSMKLPPDATGYYHCLHKCSFT